MEKPWRKTTGNQCRLPWFDFSWSDWPWKGPSVSCMPSKSMTPPRLIEQQVTTVAYIDYIGKFTGWEKWLAQLSASIIIIHNPWVSVIWMWIESLQVSFFRYSWIRNDADAQPIQGSNYIKQATTTHPYNCSRQDCLWLDSLLPWPPLCFAGQSYVAWFITSWKHDDLVN